MSQPWFDSKTGTLLLDEYVSQRPSFRKVMEDSVVTDEEVTSKPSGSSRYCGNWSRCSRRRPALRPPSAL